MLIYFIDHFAFQNIGFYRYAPILIKGCLSGKLVFTETSNPWRKKRQVLSHLLARPPVMLQVPDGALEPQQVHMGQSKDSEAANGVLIHIEGKQAFMN